MDINKVILEAESLTWTGVFREAVGVRARVDTGEAESNHTAPLVRNIRQPQHYLKTGNKTT